MQRAFTLITSLVVGAALVTGCGKDSKTSGTQPGQAGVLTVQLNSAREGLAKEDIRAGYGFAVDEHGNYKVGPGPAGELIQGKVSPTELGELLAAVGSIDSAALEGSENAEEAAGEAGDEVTIIQGGSSRAVVSAYQSATAPGANGLHKAITTLANRYYPDSFPSECSTKTAELLALQASLQGCQVDADCGYVHWDFTAAIGKNRVSTDICRYYSPMVIGNSAAVQAAYDQLVAAFDAAETSCFVRDTACSRTGIDISDEIPAVCDAGLCRVNPAISF